MQSGAFGPGEEPASWLPAADTSESLRRRALCGSVRAARAAKSRPGAGKELGEKPGSSARPRVNVPSDPILPLDQDGNGWGNGHLKNFHYSLIRVLRAIHRRAKRCLRKGKKGGQETRRAAAKRRRVPQQVAGRAPRRCPRTSGSAPRPLRWGGTPHGSPQWGLSAPPRPAQRTSGPTALRPAPPPGSVPLRAELSGAARRGEEPRRGRARRVPAAPWFPAGLPHKGPSGLLLRAPGFPRCRRGSSQPPRGSASAGRAQWKRWSWKRDRKGVRMERKQQAEVSPERCWTAVRCFLEMDNDEICEQPNTQLGAVTFQRYFEGIVKNKWESRNKRQ